MRPYLPGLGAVMLVLALTGPAMAQSLAERIENVRRDRDAQQQQQNASMAMKLRRPLGDSPLEDVQARDAIRWISTRSEIQFVVNWDRLEMEGVETDQTVQVPGGLTAGAGIDIVLRQLEGFGVELIWEPTPWYVQIMTKQQANAQPVLRIYPIDDLLMEVPHFTNAPSFDLVEITRGDQGGRGGRGGGGGGGGRGGGGGGGQGGLFQQDQMDQEDIGMSRAERAEAIADVIRETIEPDIWRELGGTAGSIRYYQGSLIIRAPNYVHRQIGVDQALPIQPQRPTSVNVNVQGSQAGGQAGQPGFVRPQAAQMRTRLPHFHRDAAVR